MSTTTVLVILAALAGLLFKLKSYFLDKKVSNLKGDVKNAEQIANQKVGAAASADADFEQRLRDYKRQKTDSDSGSSS